jgi:hypothetical protein
MHILSGMTVVAKKDEVLATLKVSRERHQTIIKEAREGYAKKAEEAIMKKLALIREGKLVALDFSLRPPQDHTRVYDTAIKMMEVHTEEMIKLDSQQVRYLLQDDWDWMDSFLENASNFSGSALDYANAKNIL